MKYRLHYHLQGLMILIAFLLLGSLPAVATLSAASDVAVASAPGAPVLTDGEAKWLSFDVLQISFNTNQAGSYYLGIMNPAFSPSAATLMRGSPTEIEAGVYTTHYNGFNFSNRAMFILVANDNGISNILMITIPDNDKTPGTPFIQQSDRGITRPRDNIAWLSITGDKPASFYYLFISAGESFVPDAQHIEKNGATGVMFIERLESNITIYDIPVDGGMLYVVAKNPLGYGNLLTVEIPAFTAPTSVSLTNLVVSVGKLTPDFDPNITNYSVSVPNDIKEITVYATPNDPNARVIRVQRVNLDELSERQSLYDLHGRRFPLDLERNTIAVQVNTEELNTNIYVLYTITVNRDGSQPLAEGFNTEIISGSSITNEINMDVYTAVQNLTDDFRIRYNTTIYATGNPFSVTVSRSNTIATIMTTASYESGSLTTMARLNDDGTLTAIPTMKDESGNLVVLIKEAGDSVLVPLSIVANFSDIGRLTRTVHEEIILAASRMIVNGTGRGRFTPDSSVTAQDSVTMLMRAASIPVDWAAAIETGAEHGIISADIKPKEPMTRINTAHLISNVLRSFGAAPALTDNDIDELLSSFRDVGHLTDDERADLAITVKLGIFQGHGNGTMRPNDILLRSQVASLSVRLQSVIFSLR